MKNFVLHSEYEIKDIIGIGTFGEVKLGINKRTNENVAIKIIDKDKMTKFCNIKRIKREFDIIQSLDHLNIIKTHSINEDTKKYYIVMEYCEKGELFNYIVKNKRLKENEASFFFYQIINGVEYLHNKNIVHRDMKPENLLLNQNNIIKIIDFGLSNYYDDGNLLSTLCGSPFYSSPELINGQKYDGFSVDIWSIGISLYAMIYGYLPFRDRNKNVLFKQISECIIEYPDYSCVSLVAKDLLKKILVKDPNKRLNLQQIKDHPFYLKGKNLFKQRFPTIFRNFEMSYNYEDKNQENNIKNILNTIKSVNIQSKLIDKDNDGSNEKITSYIYIKKNDFKSEDKTKTTSRQKLKKINYKLHKEYILHDKRTKTVNNVIKKQRVKTPNKYYLIDNSSLDKKCDLEKLFKYHKKRAISPNIIANKNKRDKSTNKTNIQNNIKNNIRKIKTKNIHLHEKENNKNENEKNKSRLNDSNNKNNSISQIFEAIEGKENFSSYFANKKKKYIINEKNFDNEINQIKLKELSDNKYNLYKNKNNLNKKHSYKNNNIKHNTYNNNDSKINSIININNLNYNCFDKNNTNDEYRNTLNINNYAYKKKNNIYYDYKNGLNSFLSKETMNSIKLRDNSLKLQEENNLLKLNYLSYKKTVVNRRNKNYSNKIKNQLSNDINTNSSLDFQKKYSYCKSPVVYVKKKTIHENDCLPNGMISSQNLKNKKVTDKKNNTLITSNNNNKYNKNFLSNFNLNYTDRVSDDFRNIFSPNTFKKSIFHNKIKQKNKNMQKTHKIDNHKKIIGNNEINRSIDNLKKSNLFNNNYRDIVKTPNNKYSIRIKYNSPLYAKNQDNLNEDIISYDSNHELKNSIFKNYEKLIINTRDKKDIKNPYYSGTKNFNIKKQINNKMKSNNMYYSLIPESKFQKDNIENDSLYNNNFSHFLSVSNLIK